MKRSFTLFFFSISLLLSNTTSAQDSCFYTLNLFDSFGDGWNGNLVTVIIGDDTTDYTLNGIDDDGLSNSFQIPAVSGDTIIISFTSGLFITEVSYELIDANFLPVFSDGFGAPVMLGEVFNGTAECPSCTPPFSSSVDIEDIRAFQADVSWIPTDPESATLLEFGPSGFLPGSGEYKLASGAGTTLFNLMEDTEYDVYLAGNCSEMDTSIFIGPFTFRTLYAVDVGVTELLSPITGCEIGVADTIQLLLQNFGGTPQTLIPFNFSVNEVPGGVNMPQDGLYTGVLGTDSTDIVEFDASFDTSEPGIYVFRIWTDLEGDSDTSNDTTEVTIVNAPVITEYPYAQNFEADNGIWYPEAEGIAPSSWEYGSPSGSEIANAVSGSNAWVTNLGGAYNDNELSYLNSPCFDFSGFDQDPIIGFHLYLTTQACCDELFLEFSTDDGENWERLGASGTGINWYNDAFNNWWDGTANQQGWRYVQHDLTDLAGAPNVRLRFVFSSNAGTAEEGAAIDNIFIGEELNTDLAASNLAPPTDAACGSAAETVEVTLINTGDTPIGNPVLSYSVNDGPVVTETASGLLLLSGEEASYTFNQPYDATLPGDYIIKVWGDVLNDPYAGNDTIVQSYRTVVELPFREDFEGGGIPDGWNTSPQANVGNGHNNQSNVLFVNMYSFVSEAFFTTPQFGPVQEGDTLRFDYKYVDFAAGTVPTFLSSGDSLVVEASTDCGLTFDTLFVIDENNHLPNLNLATVEIPLEEYVDEFLRIRFSAVWGAGDYFLDLDNINIRRCPEDLGIELELSAASGADNADGSITANAAGGAAPYTFEWETGETGATIDSLLPGDYTLTVTDAFGCQQVVTASVSITSTQDINPAGPQLSLAPNPTSGQSTLNVRFPQPADARILVFNAMGQLIFERVEQHVLEGQYQLDLSGQSAGLYYIQVIANGQMSSAKLIRTGQ